MIKLRNIAKTYPNGFEAVKKLDLDINKGDIMGIIGYSGAGKSTLVRIINLLEMPSSGSVFIDGVDIVKLSQKELQKTRQKIGMIFQHFNLLHSRNVFGNVSFALEIAGWDKNKIKNRVEELLELVGLTQRATSYPSQISGGQKQRVAIARALANNPKILLCDEATSALDTKTTKSILQLLKDLQEKLDLTIVLITHQIEVVREICDKMCVMSEGSIVEQGNVKDVFAKPTKDITKELISFLPAVSSEEILSQRDEEIYKISFVGQNIYDPLISEVIKKFNISINILAGNIDALKTAKIGHLFVKFGDEEEPNLKAIEYLEQKGLIVEKLS